MEVFLMWWRGILPCTILILGLLVWIQPTYARSNSNQNERLILTLLAPKIQEQINEFYKERLTVSPTFSPLLGPVDLVVEYFNSHIIVNLTMTPYVGPHLDVGIDAIKFRIDNSGTVEVLEYKHIKDYELLPNWKHIIKTSFN
ncbi:DUF3888 domain-containing protein [Paenibacillus sp. V4I3]|uniref:DUF3888 domain-containing protein n=1 Tax=Paenibacillus sp. V4I3 TaxID=3042305 RepID=UPI0027D8FA57|nr:DUF3888 domain-containing protein [Paenibacillus sp. V4I3]